MNLRVLAEEPTKSRNRFARDVFDTAATHVGFVHDVTDADCWAEKISARGLVSRNSKVDLY